MTDPLSRYLEKWRKIVDRSLKEYLPYSAQTLPKAMSYSLFAGGKRLRPILVIAGAEICGLKGAKVLPAACALELIHTYSLIHDDLPAMDDDNLRRGRPTNHKVYGEGMAILAGDALLTYAFDLIAKNGKMLSSSNSLWEVVHVVAEGAGWRGMVGGQAVDLSMDGGLWLKETSLDQKKILRVIHEAKTAALIQSSILTGALLAGASKDKIKNLSQYGKKIGLAFQIADDILDIVGNKKLLGKSGSDKENKKLTYPALYGIENSKSVAQKLVTEAKKCLTPFGNKRFILRDLADYIVERTY